MASDREDQSVPENAAWDSEEDPRAVKVDAGLLGRYQRWLACAELGVKPDAEIRDASEQFRAALDPYIHWLARQLRWSRSEVADRANTIWLLVVKHVPKFQVRPGQGRLQAWVKKLAISEWWRRTQRRKPPAEEPLTPDIEQALPDHEESPEKALERAEDAEQVRAALDELPEPARALFRLRYVEGLKLTDAGHRLGMRQKQAWDAHERALPLFRAILRRHGL